MKKMLMLGVANTLIFAALILPGRAQQFILDSGTPTSGTYPILSNSEWFAGEFAATAGETITQLSAYLTSMTGNGDHFAFDIYSDNGGSFLNTRNSSLSPSLTATGTYSAPGWSSTSVNWTVPTTGNYWLAIEGNTPGTRNLPTFDVEEETSSSTGTEPALAFAYDTGTQFKTSGAPPIGLEVTIPEPAVGPLALLGLLVLSAWTKIRASCRTEF